MIDAKTLFAFCLKHKWLIDNPTATLEPIQLEQRPPGIHTIGQVRQLLDYLRERDPALLGYVAPIYFGGLRPIESARLTSAEVKAEFIEVTPEKSKTRRRRFAPINETLRAWLAVPGVQFGISPRCRRLDTAKMKLRLPWPHDVMRHTFCSYGLPKFGATKIAEAAGHSEQILFAHYRERVELKDSEAFWALRPAPAGPS